MNIYALAICILVCCGTATKAEDDNGNGILITGHLEHPRSIRKYLPENKTITTTDMKLYYGRGYHASVALSHKTVLTTGGFRFQIPDFATSSCESLDLSTGRAVEVRDMKRRRAMHRTALLEGFAYVCGGTNNTHSQWVMTSCERFNGKEWEQMPSMLEPRNRFGLVTINNKIYAVGGSDGENDLKTLEVFSVATMGWHRLPDMTVTREGLGATAFNGRVVVCGGMGFAGIVFASCEAFDPVKEKWESFPNMTKARSYFDAAFALIDYDGKLFAIGGDDYGSIESYDPEKNIWQIRQENLLVEDWGWSAVSLKKNCNACIREISTIIMLFCALVI